jgi:CDP-diacylglycerol--glycerol-3-phosphate 3-phosphatidyltransferase
MVKQIPNILTFCRLILTVVFLLMILLSPQFYTEGHRSFPGFLDLALVVFVIAGLTDAIDGLIARRLNITSKFGRMLDPLADKVLICGAFVCFAIIGEPKLFNFIPAAMAVIRWSVAGVIILREAYVTILRHIAEARGVNFSASFSGKIKMLLQSFTIGVIMIKASHIQTAAWANWLITITLAIMMVVTVISGLQATQRNAWRKQVKLSHTDK